jgi:hypothetical protein
MWGPRAMDRQAGEGGKQDTLGPPVGGTQVVGHTHGHTARQTDTHTESLEEDLCRVTLL